MFAGTNGFLDKIAVDKVLAFEARLYEKLDSSHKGLAEKIRNEKILSDDIKSGMRQLAEEVEQEFLSE